MTKDTVSELLGLLDWRRRIFELYADVRADPDPGAAWSQWQQTRSTLFREHPQSPVPEAARDRYSGPHVYAYDSAWRAIAEIESTTPTRYELTTSNVEMMAFSRWGRAHFQLPGHELSLELYWLEGYGGGLFVPFADVSSGGDTYGAGRYLLDTVKGADLGLQDGRLVLDFNFAYQPSCSYDPRWTCPLAPPANRLALPVAAGERVTAG